MRGLNFIDSITAQLSPSGRRHGGAAGLVACGERPGLSGPPGPHPRRRLAGRHDRYRRAPDGAVAGQAARPAVRDREPSRRRHQHRHRARRARAARRLHVVHGQLEQRGEQVALPRYRLQVLRRPDAGLGLDPLAAGHAGASGGAGRNGVRVHRLCQGRPRQNQYGLRRQGRDRPCRRRAVPDDGRGQIPAHPVSRRGAGDDRPDRRTGAAGVRHDRLVAGITSRPASCARSR